MLSIEIMLLKRTKDSPRQTMVLSSGQWEVPSLSPQPQISGTKIWSVELGSKLRMRSRSIYQLKIQIFQNHHFFTGDWEWATSKRALLWFCRFQFPHYCYPPTPLVLEMPNYRFQWVTTHPPTPGNNSLQNVKKMESNSFSTLKCKVSLEKIKN